VHALRLPDVPAGQPGWAVEWTVVARAEQAPLVAICYEVVAGRRFGHGPHVLAIAEVTGAGAQLLGAAVVDREAWGTIIGSPIRFVDLGGPAVLYAPLSDGDGRVAILRRGQGTALEVLASMGVRGVTSVELVDRTGDGARDLVLLRERGPEDVFAWSPAAARFVER